MSENLPPSPPVSSTPPRRRKRDRIRTVIRTIAPPRSFFGEVAAVGLGVLLALLAHSWWLGVRGGAEWRSALEGLSTELAVNRVVVDDAEDYHRAAQDALEIVQARHQAGELDANPATAIPEGLRPARLQHTAWQTALATGSLDRLDFATLEKLSRVYTTQEAYDLLAANLQQAVTSANFVGDLHDPARHPQITSALIGVLRELLAQEESLKIAYTEAAEALATLLAEPAADGGSP